MSEDVIAYGTTTGRGKANQLVTVPSSQMILRFNRLRPTAKNPVRAHASDAGADIFFAPEDDQSVLFDAGEAKLLATGLRVEVPHGYVLRLWEKSGLAAKGWALGGGVVDAGYAGEIFVNLRNLSGSPKVIAPGDKIAQAVLIPVIEATFVPTDEELYTNDCASTTRGAGGYGSTGER